MNEDIYSIGFVCQIRDDLMGKYLNISTGQLISETATSQEAPEEQPPDTNNYSITSFENFEEADYKKVMT